MRNFFAVQFSSRTILTGLTAALVLGSSAQAQTSHLAYEYQYGRFAAEAEINPLTGRLLGRALNKEVPSTVSFSATELAGSFTIPETTTTMSDGVITLDPTPVKAFLEPYLQQAMGQVAQNYSLPKDVGLETFESLLNYRLVGQGVLESDSNSTAFTFEYGDSADLLMIRGIDPSVLAECKVQTCKTQLDGDFDLKLDVQGFRATSDELGIQLPSKVQRALRQAQLFGLKEVAFADGNITSTVQVLPELPLPAGDLEPASPELTKPGDLEPTVQPVAPEFVPPQAQLWNLPPKTTTALPNLPQLTRGNFVLTAERLTAPWSMVFTVPYR